MWKRKWMLGAAVTSLLIAGNSIPANAWAACGGDPPLPSGGLSSPASGPIARAWSLNCTTDSGHRGVDITLPAGTTISATADGIVSFVGYTPAEGGGTTMAITHDSGLKSTYLHISQAIVQEGAKVFQGEPIGTSNGTPLHFGIKLSGSSEKYYDPTPYLAGVMPVQSTIEEGPSPEADIQATGLTTPVSPPNHGVESAVATEQALATATPIITASPAHAFQQLGDTANQSIRVNAYNPGFTPMTHSPIDIHAYDSGLAKLQSATKPVLSLPGDLHVSDISTRDDQTKPASEQYRQSEGGALLPYRNSVLPLAAAMIITVLLMRGRKIGLHPASC